MTDIDDTLEERRGTHGHFCHHATVTQTLKQDVNEALALSGVKLSMVQKEAIDMILHKVGRIVSGNPNHKDHWVDIAGYAKLPTLYDDTGPIAAKGNIFASAFKNPAQKD